MLFTDKEAKRQLRLINHCELTDSINNYPESEVDDKSDLQILYEEALYFLEMYEEDTVYYDSLREAKEYMAETKNGKVFKGLLTSKELTRENLKVQVCKNTVNEYKRLKRGVERLRRLSNG